MSQQASSYVGEFPPKRYDRWRELAGSGKTDRRWEKDVEAETENLLDDFEEIVSDMEYFVELLRDDLPRDHVKEMRYQVLRAISRLAKVARDL